MRSIGWVQPVLNTKTIEKELGLLAQQGAVCIKLTLIKFNFTMHVGRDFSFGKILRHRDKDLNNESFWEGL